jgi:erythrocyte band 7 integral membrane protein
MVSSQTHGSTTLNTAAESFTSSTRPIIDNRISTDQHTTTATMSSINGKAPVNGAGAPPLDAPLIKVQPPRREDLQPSYAQVIKPDDADADTNGWYGSMASSIPHPPQHPSNRPSRSTLLVAASELSAQFPAASCARIRTSP